MSKLFITGAAGYIGGSVAVRLLRDGHEIRGLVRKPEVTARLKAMGITPVIGTLDDSALLEREAASADAVINAASSDHRGAVEALLEGLRGSGKAMLQTSGSGLVIDDAMGAFASDHIYDDEHPIEVRDAMRSRYAIDQLVLAATSVRGVVICPSMVYGVGRGLHQESVQIPMLVHQALDSGQVRLVGKGLNRWSNVHIDDLTDLFARALAGAPAGAFYFSENGEASFEAIGAAIAARLGLPNFASFDDETGQKMSGLGTNSRVRGLRARRELGWQPHQVSLIDWIHHELPFTKA